MRDVDWLPTERRRQTFLDLYLLAVEACLHGGAQKWWRHAFRYNQADDLNQILVSLKDFCVRQLLLEAGDVATFIHVYEVLEKEGALEGDERGRFLIDLMRYVRGVLKAAHAGTSHAYSSGAGFAARAKHTLRAVRRGYHGLVRRAPVVLSVVIPDATSCGNFLELCAPSLAGDGGIRSLAKRQPAIFHVFGRACDRAGVVERLEALALDCAIAYQEIPDDFIVRTQDVAGPQGEWLVGTLQCLHLMEAKRLGGDFCSINPHGLYADGYFDSLASLRQKGKEVVLAAALYTNYAKVRGMLAPYQRDAALAVPSGDLVNIGLEALPRGSSLRQVRNVGYLGGPTSLLQLVWEYAGRVQIHGTQHELAFLSRRILASLPARFFMKPSTEVDKMVGVGEGRSPYFVSEGDRAAVLDVSGRQDVIDGSQFDLTAFGSLLWGTARECQAEYFRQAVCLEVSRPAGTRHQLRDDAEIATERDAAFAVIDGLKHLAEPTGSQALTALGVLNQCEMSEYGLDDMPFLIDEGRRILDLARTGEGEIDDPSRRELIRVSLNFDYFDKAVALAKAGGASAAFISDFLVEMARLKTVNESLARQLRTAFGEASASVVGAIVWGERFVDKFMNYCLSSLLAPGNIPALAQKGKVVLSIVTTEADRDRIAVHPALARLRRSAEVVFTCFPPEFLERREKDGLNFYHFYGLLDHQSVFLAVALRADLYLLPIDCVYSSECLKNFSTYLEEDADCCSVGAIEAEEADLRAWIDANRGQADILDIPGKELIRASSQHPDRYFRSMIMSPDSTEFCAHPRELVWPLSDGLAVHSIFMHPLAVSARMLTRPFHPHHENVDYALLPRLLQGDGRMKVIEDGSEATLAHFGAPATRNEYLDGGFSIRAFIDAHRYDYAVHRRFFATQQFFPCRDLPYVASSDYRAEFALIQSALMRSRFQVEPA